MQLRRIFTGLAVAGAMTLASVPAGATTRFLMGGLDRTIGMGGKNVCIVSGKVTAVSAPQDVAFPGNSGRTIKAIDYTITGKVLQCTRYTASDEIQETHFKMYAGDIKDNPKPVLDQEGVFIWFGNSALGLSSLVGGEEGRYLFQNVDGNAIVQSPYGNNKGLVIVNKDTASKLMSTQPAVGKFLRAGPAVPTEEGAQPAEGGQGMTRDVLEAAIKGIVQGGNQ